MPGKLLTAGHGAPDPAEYMQNTIYFDIDSGRYYEADGSGHLFASASTGQMSPMATFNSHRNRTDNPHVVTYDQVGAASTAQGAKADTALQSSDIASKVNTSDSRLSDARTPAAHASTHAGGSDPLTLSEAQITNLTADLAGKVPVTRAVNGHALSSDVTVTKSDVGLGSVANSLQLVAASNLSDLASATTARTNLGVAIGSQVQAWDADLDAISALSGTSTIYYRNGAGTWSPVTIGASLSFSGGTLSLPALIARTVQSVTISASTYTLQPTAEIVLITCTVSTSTVTLSETGAVTGSIVLIVNVGSNPVIIQDQTGVSETSGNFTVGANDSISFVYTGDRYVEVGRSNN